MNVHTYGIWDSRIAIEKLVWTGEVQFRVPSNQHSAMIKLIALSATER